MTTNTDPKSIRLALIAAGVDTNQLDIRPSSHGVLITTLNESPAMAELITAVAAALIAVPGFDDVTRRSPYALKVHSQRRPRRGRH